MMNGHVFVLLLLLCAFSASIEVASSLQEQLGFRFTRSTYELSVPENSVGKTYARSAPGDGRIGIHIGAHQLTDIRFKIVSGDKDRFFKAEDRLVGDFCFLFIRTRTGNNDVLNRERKDKYLLEVRAVGTYREGKQKVLLDATVKVTVTILDTNDLSPLFYPTEYNSTLFEDTPVHGSVLRVLAEDADLGRNGEIYYSFAEETEQFAVHPTTGVISLSKPLRYADASYHELTVIGQDRGVAYRSGGSMLSKAKVHIRVKKVNLYAPEIRIRNHPQIVENANADIYAIVHVTDRDSGIHGEILSLEIVDGDPDGHFRIRQTQTRGEYNIEVQKLLDRELTPQGYSLQLRAVDCGIPPRDTYKSVQVHLADLNDNAPVFNKEIYEVKVSETAPVNTPLIRLKVTDADQGRNAQVSLEIVGGNEGGEFYVNPESGMLYTATQLDAETKSLYSLTVSAVDQGNAGTRKQSSAKVKIYVEDANDNDPVFDKPTMSVWLDENLASGSSVAVVHASDRDRGENAYISYLVVNLVEVPFDVDHFSGVVRTTALLDYERMRREYVLRVRASDWGLPYRRQTEMELTVRLRDINDNRPQFERVDCRGSVPRSLPIGGEVLTMSAIDFDAGNIISYSIVGGNEDGCFTIDNTSGAISVGCDLSDVRVAQRDLNVTATDGTHFADVAHVAIKLVHTKQRPPTLRFECRETGVTRRLTEVLAAAENNNRPPEHEQFAMMPTRYGQNIHTPEFVDFPVQIRVNESVALGTTLIRVRARDRDLGYNGELVFGISGGDEHSVFCLDVDSGELRVIGYLDRERVSEYLLNVTVYDLGRPQKSTSRVLPVVVLDVNDNAPKFTKSLASFRVAENALNGTIIFRAHATDVDAGDNARITYSLVTDTRDFTLHRTSGVLSVAGQLDRERQEDYELRIRATDSGGKVPDSPPMFSDALVRVRIDDVNDNAPTFSLPSYTVKVREDVPKGSVVAVIFAADPDLGPEGEVVYRLADSDTNSAFKIDRHSGTIRSTKALDYEEAQVHNLIVVASDGGNPSLSGETSITINVVDVNENIHTPHFSDLVYNGSVSEDAPVGSVVLQVHATDLDAPGDDSKIEYSIRGGDGIGIFTIDKNGTIRTQAVLDYETTTHYWLTVYAQDHGVVPLYSSVEVYIRVINENDNVPLSEAAVYHATVAEDSLEGTVVTQLYATDMDEDVQPNITFTIVAGNPEGFFAINSTTGVITTTARRLDRERQEEYILEISISDNGKPALSSTTRAVVTVTDINDNAPEFEQTFYKVQVPVIIISHRDFKLDGRVQQLEESSSSSELEVQNDMAAPGDFDGADSADDGGAWELSTAADVEGLQLIARVLAFDKDSGKNSEIEYSLRSGRGLNKFKIHNTTGAVYLRTRLAATDEYELQIRATDGGNKSTTCRMMVNALSIERGSKQHPPELKSPIQHIQVTENDVAGYLVCLVQASDADNDTLWYNIVSGDADNEFYIGPETGNLLLAHRLDYERRTSYVLNISVTDALHTVYGSVHIAVIDINDNAPEFSAPSYHVDVSEAATAGAEVVRLHATDADRSGGKLVYTLHAARNRQSARFFRVDSLSGVVTLVRHLDREVLAEHVLVVAVRDGGTPAKRTYARLHVAVHDHNDHAPHFCAPILIGKVHETAAIGSAVLRALAVDGDRGENARITYAIASGNVGSVFDIDAQLGVVRVARELDLAVASEYTLYVKATDHGQPPLVATVPAHITITMADNAPPRFVDETVTAEIFEDKHIGSYVAHLNVRTTSSLQFEIVDGNTNDTFAISPSTGVLVTKTLLDYELVKVFNLTVSATNMASASATCTIFVHVLDKNDNAPQFLQAAYAGVVSETVPVNSLILTNDSSPLVIKAVDGDSDVNALLHYDIVESLPRQYFHIDTTTGAIRTTRPLDFETIPKFTFHVQVSDSGKPRLSAEVSARVEIIVTDVNDCAPVFSHPIYNATLLLPTYKHVAVVQLNASDPDSAENTHLRFDILDGNKMNLFVIDTRTGLIRVLAPDALKSHHVLQVRVSDGLHSSITKVYINVEQSENSGLTFHKSVYTGSVMENTTKPATVCVVNVLGSALNEHLDFNILNPSALFTIGRTSGVIQTTGVRFDRERHEFYHLVVEARSASGNREKPRVAHVIVNVTVMDENDNCPMFVNLPYYAVVSIDDRRGSVITKVHAIDMDSDENGEVRYELIKGSGELFKVQRDSGDVELKQSLEGHNREYELLIAAYDKGLTPCRSDVTVYVKVIDRSMPVFKKQFYSDTIPENTELHTSLPLAVQAESPLGRKLIYSIVKGNELEEFELDFNTAPNSNNGPCVLFVADELDYEERQQFELTVRATDAVSGVFADVPVSILLQDVNDNPPVFTQESYNVSVSEAAAFGSPILRVLAIDRDEGINKKLVYSIRPDAHNNTDLFYVDEHDGTIFLKQSLDHETITSHHFIVEATDEGLPRLSSITHVWVQVLDMNDNLPKFEQPSYFCAISMHAKRDQFVTIVSASDPDSVDRTRLHYTIIAGNEHQTFSMHPQSGIITLMNLANFGGHKSMLLNVSVSDGVYTNFARVKVELLPANLHSPAFADVLMNVELLENQPANTLVADVKALDEDFGDFGVVNYAIQSDLLAASFVIDQKSGRITSRVAFDREAQKVYEIPVMATDGGGRSAFQIVRVTIGDENDNAPKFALREYKSSIAANFNIGAPFMHIRAIDLDDSEGGGGALKYSIYEDKSSGGTDLFAIDATSGGISLVQNAAKFEGEVFQFFIRATDTNALTTPLHSDVPVNVFIMSPSDRPPIFERKDEKFFFSENSVTGTIITRLKMVSNVSVTFQIVSGSEDEPQFAVDSNGVVSLARPLDYEAQTSHLIGILAETDSSPPLTALNEITVQVLDENDHAPEFESKPYILHLAENVVEGTSILKVIAHDNDQGSNGEVRYNFGSSLGDAVNVFALDSFTGWITTLIKLDKETKAEYKFSVIATDNGSPKYTAHTSVLIKLMDYNDSPPQFKKKVYHGAINEDALPGTVVITLEVTDADDDLNTPVQFYIVADDPVSNFQVRETGELYVVKALDRETVPEYNLNVIVTDGLFTDTARVVIQVLDVNDNPPYCLVHRYSEVLSEALLPGTFVLNVKAIDIDDFDHSKLRYFLTGNGSSYFSLDKDSGYLKTITHLDREKQNKFLLTGHVQDREHLDWECSSQIELFVSDVNDNEPKFSSSEYSVSVEENVDIGTLITKVHATDADIGINRKIKYFFADTYDDFFKLEPDSGIITLMKPLDREQKAAHSLTIRAVDQGTPQLSSSALLKIIVQDINDNPPEFASKQYFAIVPEIDAIGTEVARVLATSKDTGVNADIYYTIIGGNEHRKFVIDKESGMVHIGEALDFERAHDYFLTIQATDGGTPPLSNIATLNISVTDCNDNAPIFGQSVYHVRVREDAQIGERITQVTATDLDSDANGRVEYSIIHGDAHQHFTIDSATGHIAINNLLDRETVSSYVLEVLAKDNGLPVLSRQANVNVEISDTNDNPPLFSQTNYSTIIQEDKPIGYPIIKFLITDNDDGPNTKPYTYDFLSGNEASHFRLEQDGILRTATKFNHKVKDNFLLQIRVFDNGSPPLYSDAWVLVKVIEESQYPPVLTPLEININSFLDEFAGGNIGKVYANDQDKYDSLTYSLEPTVGNNYPTQDYFKIDRTNGTLRALPRLDIGEYRLNVSVTDGKYNAYTIVRINVEIVTEDMLDNAIVIRFREVSPDAFVLSHRKGFLRAIRAAMKSQIKDVVIISVQPYYDELAKLREKRFVVEKDLDILFTVRKPDTGFYSMDALRKTINGHLEELEDSTKLVVEEIVQPKCTSNYCLNGICHDRYTLDTNRITPISTEITSFVSASYKQRLECTCKEGYGGDKCDIIVNECARNPCPIYKICIPDASIQQFSCQCPQGYAGVMCDADISNCHDESCYIARNPISFNGKSYAQYGIINKKLFETQLNLSLRIRTVQPTGNLMYAAGRVDYNILELINGALQYRFELGSGEGVVHISASNMHLSDGKWHEVRLEREKNTARLTVDGYVEAQGSAPGISDALNLQGDQIYLGAEVYHHPSILGLEDIRRGFVGCMDDVRISKVSVPLHVNGDSSIAALRRFSNVDFNCDAAVVLTPMGACGSQPCLNGGTCIDTPTGGGFECVCHDRFKGALCEIDTNPCTSAPCLYGGKCVTTGSDYHCDCLYTMSGKRCEYGRYCHPNPCKNGGVCEEGDDGPLCKCRAFVGEFCEFDVDECQSEPCHNGGQCLNEIGAFRCICPTNTTGSHCGTMLAVITPFSFPLHITIEQFYIICAACVLLLLFIITCTCVACWWCRRRRRRFDAVKDNKSLSANNQEAEVKRGSKISNLEMDHHYRDAQNSRPLSFTPSSIEPYANCNSVYNNLDTLRSYGSAGDELENILPDYYKNINRNQPEAVGNYCDSDKIAWASQMHLGHNALFNRSKFNNQDAKVENLESSYRNYGARPNAKSIKPKTGHRPEDARHVANWASQPPLPKITEVNGSEVHDSSSFQSNESNESRGQFQAGAAGAFYQSDIESDFQHDSDVVTPSLNGLNSGCEDCHVQKESAINYPEHRYNIYDKMNALRIRDEFDDVRTYEFPTHHNCLQTDEDDNDNEDDDIKSIITSLDERHSLIERFRSSNDDLSNLCDIEDSENETEDKPLNSIKTIQQTSV